MLDCSRQRAELQCLDPQIRSPLPPPLPPISDCLSFSPLEATETLPHLAQAPRHSKVVIRTLACSHPHFHHHIQLPTEHTSTTFQGLLQLLRQVMSDDSTDMGWTPILAIVTLNIASIYPSQLFDFLATRIFWVIKHAVEFLWTTSVAVANIVWSLLSAALHRLHCYWTVILTFMSSKLRPGRHAIQHSPEITAASVLKHFGVDFTNP